MFFSTKADAAALSSAAIGASDAEALLRGQHDPAIADPADKRIPIKTDKLTNFFITNSSYV
jgi:hypothetical protein